ncbi:HD domain-containing protein [Mycobacterium sp. smrl_JER01]|uniref:HD domain-containing protein n=1 Tax=Mycobacterium sp. smrl_JER01 TaxID=3402633 RepID=UPI003AD776B6
MSGALTHAARALAAELMADQPTRFKHLAAVAARSDALSAVVADTDVDALVAAGWLHDIGYCPDLAVTGFHPLDGALYLRDEGWPQAVCALVAHHSGSRFVAPILGLLDALSEFEFAETPSSDALTTADNTATQQGTFVTLAQRLTEKKARHAPDSPGMLANPARDDYIIAAAGRVRHRLLALGGSDPYLH